MITSILLLTIAVVCNCNAEVVVLVKDAYFTGKDSVFHPQYYSVDTPFACMSFVGVPYAEPWQQSDRFEKTRPLGRIKDTKATMESKPVCFQTLENTSRQHEDCLYLNIFAPLHRNDKGNVIVHLKYPVLFVIPGVSHSKYAVDLNNGCSLTKEKMVVVTVGYRMGPLGFLALNDGEFPGNYGLHDIRAALDWVFNYIEYFGGLKNKITILGHGSGAVQAAILLTDTKYSGIIHAGVLLSGAVTSKTEYIDDIKYDYESKVLNTLRDNFDCFDEKWTYKRLKDCLKKYQPEHFYHDSMLKLEFLPMMDNIYFPDLADKRIIDVPIYIGALEDEFGRDKEMRLNLDDLKKEVRGKNDVVADLIKTKYSGNYNAPLNENQILGDLAISLPTLHLAENLSEHHNVFYFTFQHPNMYHGFFMSYLFPDTPESATPNLQYNRKLNHEGAVYTWEGFDRELSRQLSNLFISIAHDNREPVKLAGIPVKWSKYTASKQSYLSVNPMGIRAAENPFLNERSFWETAVPEVERKLNQKEEEAKCFKRLAIILAVCLGVVASIAFVLAAVAIWYHIKVGHLKEIIEMNALAK